jgi:hypothetical protein
MAPTTRIASRKTTAEAAMLRATAPKLYRRRKVIKNPNPTKTFERKQCVRSQTRWQGFVFRLLYCRQLGVQVFFLVG